MTEKLVDLHTHSVYSDGTLSPRELVRYAAKKQLYAIALTDHDTVAGLPYAHDEGEKLGVKIINGVEITATFRTNMFFGEELHILGLGFTDIEKIKDSFRILEQFREKRNRSLISRFNDQGIDITYDELQSISSNNITRAHFVKLLMEKGYGDDFYELINKYFVGDVPTNIPKEAFAPTAAIKIIHDSGGIAVFAHPLRYGFKEKDVRKVCRKLKDCGLDALEAVYSTHTPDNEKFLRNLAKDLDLKISGGSDFHGGTKPGIDLGCGYGDLVIPASILENLNI
ncbi:MAG: PHP domain-containing protein [Defluviitaleaceae bacterium]|nr:PHP domain-containing protein [Defluviitaleaceae bacterium]